MIELVLTESEVHLLLLHLGYWKDGIAERVADNIRGQLKEQKTKGKKK
jgi:hypothetical protein